MSETIKNSTVGLGNWCLAASADLTRLRRDNAAMLAALIGLQEFCAADGWWLKGAAARVMDTARTAIAQAQEPT